MHESNVKMGFILKIVLVSLCVMSARCSPALVIYAVDTLFSDPPYNYTSQFELQKGLPQGSIVVISYESDELASVIQQPNLNPVPDVVIGIDNINQYNLSANSFLAYNSPSLNNIPSVLYGRTSAYSLLPYEYGRIAIIANVTRIGGAFDPNSLTLSSVRNRPDILRKLIIEDPTLAVEGAAFLLSTIATYGDASVGIVGQITTQGDWRQWWRDVLPYVKVFPSWDSAFAEFDDTSSQYSLMVSYELDPIYNHCVEGLDDTVAVLLNGSLWYLIESLGIYKDAANVTLAQEFVDWFLSSQVQTLIPDHEWMFPAEANITLPSCYRTQQVLPEYILNENISSVIVASNLKSWVSQWSQIYQASVTTSTTSLSTSSNFALPILQLSFYSLLSTIIFAIIFPH